MGLSRWLGPVLVVLAAACTPGERAQDRRPGTPEPDPPDPDPATPAPATPPARDTRYRAAYTVPHADPDAGLVANFVFVRGWGFSPDGATAWVAYSNTNRVPLTDELVWGVDEIDLARGVHRKRWKQTVGQADRDAKLTFGMLWPLVDAPADVARLARISKLTGSPELGTQVEVSHDGALALHHRYGDDRAMGDWLTLRDAATGEVLRRLDGGMLASYAPAFSPDDAHVAFTATVPGRGAEGSGGYGLYVQRLADDHRRRLADVGHATSIWWSSDGQQIWSVGQGLGAEASQICARRHELDDGAVTEVTCMHGLRDARAIVSPDGGYAVIWGRHDPTGARRDVLIPVDVRAGTVGARVEVDGAAQPVAVRDDGLMLLNRRGGACFGRLEADDDGLETSAPLGVALQGPVRWLPDGSVLAFRTAPDGQGTAELVVEQLWPDRL